MDAIEEALNLANPFYVTINALSYNRESHILRVKKQTVNLNEFRRVYVIAFGKASIAMTEGLYNVLGSEIEAGLIISPFTRETKLPKDKFEIFVSSHPHPDERSVHAAELILSFLNSKVTENDLLFVLISGGGTSLIFKPIPPLTVHEFLKINSMLLKSGLSINEINVIRKHLSIFGGGKLLNHIPSKKVISLIISDVVGDDISTIASGPTSPDTYTFQDVQKILTSAHLIDKIPSAALKIISEGINKGINETLKPGSPLLNKVVNVIIFRNLDLLQSLKAFFEKRNIKPIIITSSLVGEAREVAKVIYAIANDAIKYTLFGEPPLVFLLGGETTVTVRGTGLGGRNQELVSSFLQSMKLSDKVIIASFGTDGIDGPTDAAGAICDWETKKVSIKKRLSVHEYLMNNDSYNLLKQLNALIFTGYTGSNVNDVVIVYIPRSG